MKREKTKLMVTIHAVLLTVSVTAADPTLVWTGNAGDWKWETAGNWSLGAGSSGDVATLLTKQAIYDLSALAGQTNTITSKNAITFGGLTLPACATGATPFDIRIQDTGNTSLVFPVALTIKIPTSCRLTLGKKKDANYNTTSKAITLDGGGTLKLDAAFQTASRTIYPKAGTRLECGENMPLNLATQQGLGHTYLYLYGSKCRLILDRDMSLGIIEAPNPKPYVDLNGHTLYMTSAGMVDRYWNHKTSSVWGLNFTGAGTVSFSGQHTTTMTNKATLAALRVGNADCTWDKSSSHPANTVRLIVDGPGSMTFKGGMTAAGIAGEGVSGALRLAGNLTLSGSGLTSTTYDARILGTGGLNKKGADYALTLTGVNGYDGATTVSEGSLVLKRENKAVPRPFCHWTFDDESNPGVDSAESGMTLALSNVAMIAEAPFANGKALCIQGGVGCAYFDPAKSGAFPARFPTGRASFSVSCRFRQTAAGGQYACLVGWGNQKTVQKFFMLEKQGDPRKLVVNWNTTANYGQALTADEMMDYTPMTYGAEWTHAVVTVDRVNGEARLYTDGRLVSTSTSLASLDIDPSGILSIGLRTTKLDANAEVYVDDVQIFDRVLDAFEVKQVVRALSTGSVGPVLPSTSAVTVAAGATLKAEGLGHEIASLAGEGTLDVVAGSSIAVRGSETFSGVVTGTGAIRTVAGACPAFEGDGSAFKGVIEYAGGQATFSSSFDGVDRAFAEGVTLTTDELPAVVTAGRMRLPSSLTLDLGAVVPLNQTLVLAEAGSFVTPDGTAPDSRFFKNWKWTPEGADYKVKYFVKGGKLCAFVGKPGLILLFR